MKLFYTTEEVAKHFDLPLPTLVHYVSVFNLKINIVKRTRKFSHADLEKVEQIVRLIREEGYTIEGAKEKFKAKKVESVKENEVLERLIDIKKTLQLIRNHIED